MGQISLYKVSRSAMIEMLDDNFKQERSHQVELNLIKAELKEVRESLGH